MPISGEVVEVNQALEASPETVNASPLENGWFVKIKVRPEPALDFSLDIP
jgi:glycine cleavage system H protein